MLLPASSEVDQPVNDGARKAVEEETEEDADYRENEDLDEQWSESDADHVVDHLARVQEPCERHVRSTAIHTSCNMQYVRHATCYIYTTLYILPPIHFIMQ